MPRKNSVKILGIEYHRYQYGVLELCELLHMRITGAADRDPVTIYVAKKYLQWRIKNWVKSSPIWSRIDNSVKQLIESVLQECKEHARQLPDNKDLQCYIKLTGRNIPDTKTRVS